jgi:hypothetical protein
MMFSTQQHHWSKASKKKWRNCQWKRLFHQNNQVVKKIFKLKFIYYILEIEQLIEEAELAIKEYAQLIHTVQQTLDNEMRQLDEWRRELQQIEIELDPFHPQSIKSGKLLSRKREVKLQSRAEFLRNWIHQQQKHSQIPQLLNNLLILQREMAALQTTLTYLKKGTPSTAIPSQPQTDSERGRLEQQKMGIWNEYENLLNNEDQIIIRQSLDVLRLRLHIRQLKSAPAMARAAYKARVSRIRDELQRQQRWFNTIVKEAQRRKEALIEERNQQIDLLLKSRRTMSFLKMAKYMGQFAQKIIANNLA